MKYNVRLNESRLVLSADDSEIFFSEFSKLPVGEYTIEILGDGRRPVRRRRKKLSIKTVKWLTLICEVATVLTWLLSCVALWIIVAFFV